MRNKPLLWFLCPKFGGTSEVWMYRQATLIKRLDVHVICRDLVNPDIYESVNIDVTKIPSTVAPSKSRLKRFGFIARNARYGFFDGSPGELQWFSKLWVEQKPDVILCHYGTIAAHLVPQLSSWGKPIVVHFNGNDLSGNLSNWYYRWRLKVAIPHCAGFVVVADYMRDWLIENGAPEDRIVKIPYGIPLAEFSIAQDRSNRSDNICRFLAVGRFVEKKRPDLTIRAFAQCACECSNIELWLIGDGPMLEECKKLAIELGIANKVCFLGARPSSFVREQLNEADVFVQHSITSEVGDKEGWPVAIAEAAASRLPVISTTHASIPEQIENGNGGLLVPELDWQSMGKHMLELATNTNKRRAMGNAAFERISAFDIRKQIGLLEDFLCHQIVANEK